MKWDVGSMVGKLVNEKIATNEKQLEQAWGVFRQYAPAETVENVDRMLALATLGFQPTSTPTDDEIRAAFLGIAKECHPDKSKDPQDHARYTSASAARDLLLSPRKP